MEIKVIQAVLLENKIRPNIKGYKYCFEILKELCHYDAPLNEVYEKVAKKFQIKANSVEKGVSNAISKAFLEREMQEKYSQLCWKTGKVKNKKFLCLLKSQIFSHK